VAGADEAGRGSLAGPLVAASVLFDYEALTTRELRSLAALNDYPGTVYFEGTNVTEGRGTDRPFEQVGLEMR